MQKKEHWNAIYQKKEQIDLTWHQDQPVDSLQLISELKIPKDANIIDIGGGRSKLAENLLQQGYQSISVLDLSSSAIQRQQEILGEEASKISWIISDILNFQPQGAFQLWHDRATFHFLIEENDINRYIDLAQASIAPNGKLILATFSENGPLKCSGLPITQYSEEQCRRIFSPYFHLERSFELEHHTPWNSIQMFRYNILSRIPSLS